MGEFSRQLLEVNGESGHTYRLQRRGGQPVDMEALNDVRHRVESMGHHAVMGALETRAEGDIGIIKILPELTTDEIVILDHEAGIRPAAA